jgi:hypothetical protein
MSTLALCDRESWSFWTYAYACDVRIRTEFIELRLTVHNTPTVPRPVTIIVERPITSVMTPVISYVFAIQWYVHRYVKVDERFDLNMVLSIWRVWRGDTGRCRLTCRGFCGRVDPSISIGRRRGCRVASDRLRKRLRYRNSYRSHCIGSRNRRKQRHFVGQPSVGYFCRFDTVLVNPQW